MPDTELPAWYTAADVLAFPSTKEGWGLAVLEAMSAGLPVVTSDLPAFLEYLRSGRDALVVPVDDAAALSRALAAILDDPGLAAELRAAGLAVSRQFTWSRAARRSLRLPGQPSDALAARSSSRAAKVYCASSSSASRSPSDHSA